MLGHFVFDETHTHTNTGTNIIALSSWATKTCVSAI